MLIRTDPDCQGGRGGGGGVVFARVVFAAWWEANTGQAVPELLDDGRTLHCSELHRRTRPRRPKDPREDRR